MSFFTSFKIIILLPKLFFLPGSPYWDAICIQRLSGRFVVSVNGMTLNIPQINTIFTIKI